LCWRWRSWDKQPQNVPGQGQDRMAHKGSLVSDKKGHQTIPDEFLEQHSLNGFQPGWDSVLVTYCCCNKLPHAGYLKQ
jgi:hypothetical protein